MDRGLLSGQSVEQLRRRLEDLQEEVSAVQAALDDTRVDATELEVFKEEVETKVMGGDELFEFLKQFNGRDPSEYTDAEMVLCVKFMQRVRSIIMVGSTPEAQAAVSAFYGAFGVRVATSPKYLQMMDPFYVGIDFAGQAPPPGLAAHIANAPVPLGVVDASGPLATGSVFGFAGQGAPQHWNARTFIGHVGGGFGAGGLAAGANPLHLVEFQTVVPPVWWY